MVAGISTPCVASLERKFGRSPVERSGPSRALREVERRRRATGVMIQVLQRDDVAFEPEDLGDAAHAAAAVDEADEVDDEVEGRGDLLAHGAQRKLDAAP